MATKSYIGQIKIGNDTSPVGSTLYGICNTSASAAAKTITTTDNSGGVLEKFDNLVTGVTIHVKFTNGNTSSAPTLQVGSMTTAPAITNPNGTLTFAENTIVSLTYDGTNWVVNASQATPGTVVQTYDSTSEDAISGKGVANAFTTLTDTLTGTPGSGKTITAFDQVNGKVSATFGNISITKSQVSDFSHTHGNLTNDGKLENASYAVVTDGDKKITTVSLAVTDNTTVGTTATKFVAKVTQNAQGKITVTKADLPEASTSVKGIIQIGDGANQALAGNSQITIAGNTVNLAGGSLEAATLRESLKLSAALRFIGSVANDSSYKPGDGTTGKPTITGVSNYTPIVGDVVLSADGDAEYVCVAVGGTTSNPTYTWERLGRDGSFALTDEVILKSLTSTAGDMIYASSAKNPARLAIGAANTFLKSDGTKPVWTTINSTTVGLGNVTNEAQIPKSIGTAAGDIIYWSGASTPVRLAKGSAGQVLTIDNDTNLPVWAANAATDKKVEQKKYTSNTNSEFRLLFKKTANNTDETDLVYYSDIADKNITYNPSTGALSAAKFIGDGSSLENLSATAVKTALDYVSTTANTTLSFLHKSGAWKTISLKYTDNNTSGKVVTGVSHSGGSLPTLTGGTLASASVSQGILTIVNQVHRTFSQGSFPTVSVSKADIAIQAS